MVRSADTFHDSLLNTSQPRYMQLAKTLVAEIADGKYAVGDLLPTEQELCTQFGISRFTAREALKKLVQSGLVTRQPGVGTKVVSSKATSAYSQNMAGISDLYQYATDTTLVIEKQEIISLTEAQSALVEGTAGETWLHLQGKRFVADNPLPICVTEIWIHPAFRSIRGVLGEQHEAIHSNIEQQFGETIATVDQQIHAISLTRAHAAQLQARAGSPCLKIVRKYRNRKGELIEVAVSTHAADRYSYHSVFNREWRVEA